MRVAGRALVVLLMAPGSGVALGGKPIPNWPAPAIWSPPRASGVTALSVTNPFAFIGVTPCRVADTRGNGFIGQYGPPALGANVTRNFTIVGQCGIPADAQAVSFNFAALNVGGTGDLRVFPAGGGVPLVSTLNYNGNTPNIANAAVVPLGTGGAITVQADAISIDLIIDINGYYAMSSASSSFEWDSAGTVGIVGISTASTGVSLGVVGQVHSSTDGSAGVSGASFAATGTTYGVAGSIAGGFNAAGVYGSNGTGSPTTIGYSPAGVRGVSRSGVGVLGLSRELGVSGQAFDSSGNLLSGGTLGSAFGPYGVFGELFGVKTDEAGVIGVDATGPAGGSGKLSAGVRGESATHFGVLGQGQVGSISGELLDSAGGFISAGVLGTIQSGHNYGVYSFGDFGGTGAKYFVEPHPTDASKVIRYVALEGPEAGTYFRGRARFSHGQARIEVPESFRLVTGEEGLTVQITPIGEMANYAVKQVDLNEIVVEGSKDVEFYYTVNGVRQTFKDLEVISSSREYMPRSPNDRMPEGFSPEQKKRLIANGTYNPDGTVNMETAERVGWTRLWKEWEERDKAAVAANAAKRAVPNKVETAAQPFRP